MAYATDIAPAGHHVRCGTLRFIRIDRHPLDKPRHDQCGLPAYRRICQRAAQGGDPRPKLSLQNRWRWKRGRQNHPSVDGSGSPDQAGLFRFPFVDHLTQGRGRDTRPQIFVPIAQFALQLLQPDRGRVSRSQDRLAATPDQAPQADIIADLKRLRRENEILRQARDILRWTPAFFAREENR
ncbi:hypothetical protein JYA60_11025 [Sphingomonas yabuuchiae]|uniref:Transposase n=1 Tax=Sphingomonas yabuuchiae TaxID=172044 RepID=A0AA41A282_9SPHN|nr:hypothetical protein [Sphingomonas yabuuchiae]MBN3558758.1 hypothetical protein [Sphingomonas yabuuchiae]